MRLFSGLSLAAVALMYSISCSAAEPFKEPMLSYQGFTGIINTPSAYVNQEGSIHFIYSDQRDNIWRADQQKRQDNYLMSLGLFSFFELGGRLTDAPKVSGLLGVRDLSASFKATTAPLTKEHPLWPVLAAGVQDVGGGSNLLESRYAVISEELWRFRFSAGYGFYGERMKGLFGGVEFQAHDWVTLLAENDTKNNSVGIRIVTPEIWKTPIQLAGTVKSTIGHNQGGLDVAVGVTFPLDFRKKNVSEPKNVSADSQLSSQKSSSESPAVVQQTVVPLPQLAAAAPQTLPAGKAVVLKNSTNTVSSATSANLDLLQKRLVNAGFIQVRVGQRASRELVVEYENTIFNHNELDALGVVAGIVSAVAPDDFETLRIVIKRKGIRVAVVSAPFKVVRNFMNQPLLNSRELRQAIEISYDAGITDDTYFHPVESTFPFPNTTLILAPGLRTAVGTDFGVFDYVLSFKPEILSTLWKGGVFQARWDIPFMWSNNFDNGKPFGASRNDAQMDRAMLFQGVNLAPGIMGNFGAGLVLHNNYGTLNEIMWSPAEGMHRFRGFQAWARDPYSHKNTESYLGSYRFFYAPLDVSLEATGGKFWGQDHGYCLELKRFFTDTSVSTYYKNTTTTEGKHWQVAGIQFAFPLTPRKDYKIGPIQIRGSDAWSYAQETTLAVGSQKTNDLVQGLGINPQPDTALYHAYYNRDRLSEGYFKEHLDRLREAWGQYRTDLFDSK